MSTPRADKNFVTFTGSNGCDHEVVLADFARSLERELQQATRLLTRCRDSAGRMELELYEDIQTFLHSQP